MPIIVAWREAGRAFSKTLSPPWNRGGCYPPGGRTYLGERKEKTWPFRLEGNSANGENRKLPCVPFYEQAFCLFVWGKVLVIGWTAVHYGKISALVLEENPALLFMDLAFFLIRRCIIIVTKPCVGFLDSSHSSIWIGPACEVFLYWPVRFV